MTLPDKTDPVLILMLWLAGVGAAAQFGKFAVIYEDLLAYYPGIGLSFMVSIVGIAGLLLGTTAGVLVRWTGYRRLLVGALLAGGVISALQATMPAMVPMLASRVIEGLSHLAIVVVGPTLISRAAAARHQGAVMTLWGSFFGVSLALTAWAGRPLVAAHGPQALFLVHALWMLVMAGLLALYLPADPARGPMAPLTLRRLVQQHGEIYRSPFVAAPALGFVFYTAIYVAMLTLLPVAVDDADQALVATGMPLVSILVSLTLGVWLLGRLQAVSVVQLGLGLSGVFVLGVWALWGSALVPFLCLALAGAMGLVQGASFASIPQLNPALDDRAQAAGAIAQLGNVGTTSGTPILAALTGWLGVAGFPVWGVPLSLAGVLVVHWLRRRRAMWQAHG